MSLALVWLLAGLTYVAFYAWYIGFKRRLTPMEVDACCQQLEAHFFTPERVAPVRAFLSQDNGRDFFIANYVKIAQQTASGESGKAVMEKYQKPFLKGIFKRGCHPIAIGLAASEAVECWGVSNGEVWTLAAFVRYRSRRDLAEILVAPEFQQIHPFKEAALDKTIAFTCDPAFIVGGGPKVTVPLALVAVASVFTILLK